jgi:hypothetical protein
MKDTDRGREAGIAAVPRLTCYPLEPDPPAIEPARAAREWMDRTDQRFAYRCLPLSIANASGWELLAPVAFEASWSGGDAAASLTIRGDARAGRFAVSHFGHGVLTLHTGYLFRTSPGWALWVRGAPNLAKRNLAALDGLVETDWLEFPFTMNWRFTRAGTAGFAEGEPFCFITPVPHVLLDRVQPEVRALDADPGLKAAYEARATGRGEFNERLASGDPDTVARGWQRHYVRGEAEGEPPAFHVTRRRLRAVRDSEPR